MRTVLSDQKSWKNQSLGGRRPGKSCCVVRYGGFGDLLQASTVFPALRERGYTVTVNTTPAGFNILKKNPFVNDFFVQEPGQVRNDDLGDYWDALAKNFDKFVQLSESVEGALLALPGREDYQLSKDELHAKNNKDYLRHIHDLAGVDGQSRPKFYPSKAERRWAKAERKKLGLKNKIVLWALSGSSVHKLWPYTDEVMAGLLTTRPDVKIVLVGDELCQLLEQPWEKEPNVLVASGKWSIRQTLSFALLADVVVGPETGVLNSVAFEDMAKVMFLSHSSPENIGGRWVNTTALEPDRVPCYPCHKIHYGFESCVRDNATGGSACAAGISADRVFNAIIRGFA